MHAKLPFARIEKRLWAEGTQAADGGMVIAQKSGMYLYHLTPEALEDGALLFMHRSYSQQVRMHPVRIWDQTSVRRLGRHEL